MSGVDIAGLVERLRELSDDPDLRSPQREVIDAAADALLAQAAELAELGAEITELKRTVDHNDREIVAEFERVLSLTRQRDEALAALKASEEARDAATKLADRYGVALMMIRAGCSNPQRFAGNILDDVKPIDIDLEDLT